MSKWNLNPILTIDSSKFDASAKLIRSAHAEVSSDPNDPLLKVETSEFAPGAINTGSWKNEYKVDPEQNLIEIEKRK